MVPNILKILAPDVPAGQFQVTAGLHIAPMRDEAETDPPQASSGHGIQSMRFRGNPFPLGPGPLAQNPVIVRGTGGFQLQGVLLPLIVKPMENFFVIISADGLSFQGPSTPRRNQKKNMVGYRS